MDNPKSRTPLVTIGMPVYNDESFVREAIESLLNQTFTDFELIISDNGSTDSSSQICQDYAKKDARIRFFQQKTNLGQIGNFNFLKDQASGEYFMWAASDDRWDKNFVALTLKALQDNTDAVMAFTPYQSTSKEGTLLGEARNLNYTGSNPFIRISKFCFLGDDACFYSLYKLNTLKAFDFKPWWGFNRRTPLNIGFPLIYYNLAAGNYILTGSKPLWFNRIKFDSAFHYEPFDNYLLIYFAHVIRKFNVFCYSLFKVFTGSRSVLYTLFCIPILFIKMLWDCVTPFKKLFSLIFNKIYTK